MPRARVIAAEPVSTGGPVWRGALRAECRRGSGASWLRVDGTTPEAARLLRAASARPAWGLHRADLSLALGDLVELVRRQAG